MADSRLRTVECEDAAAVRKPSIMVESTSGSEAGRAPRRIPLAARIVISGLMRLRNGRLTLRLPDETSHSFGANDGPHAEMTVHRWRFFLRLLRGADVGAGESYVDGDWSTPDLVTLTRLFLANEEVLAPPRLLGLASRTRDRILHLWRSNTRTRARRNIHAHYDLSNDFYLATCEAAFLDHKIGDLQIRLSRAGEARS